MSGKNDLVFLPLILRRGVFRLAGLILVAGTSFAAGPEIQAAVSSQSETNALLEIRSLTVDGSPVPLRAGEKLRLARQPRTAVFQFGPGTNSVRAPSRIRFRLDGYEENWREYPAEMRLCLRFLDGSGDQVGETAFKVVGTESRVDRGSRVIAVHSSPGNRLRATSSQEFPGGDDLGRTFRHGGGLCDQRPDHHQPVGDGRPAHALVVQGIRRSGGHLRRRPSPRLDA